MPSTATTPDANQAHFGAQLEHAAEQLGQRVLVALDKPRDRRVIPRAIRRDHPKRQVVLAGGSIARDDRVPRASRGHEGRPPVRPPAESPHAARDA